MIRQFAQHRVAANLLMLLILAFGIVSSFTIRKQTTPDFELNMIQVRVPYLGAAPQEVEEGVVIKVEEAIQDIPGIVQINSRAVEQNGKITDAQYQDTMKVFAKNLEHERNRYSTLFFIQEPTIQEGQARFPEKLRRI